MRYSMLYRVKHKWQHILQHIIQAIVVDACRGCKVNTQQLNELVINSVDCGNLLLSYHILPKMEGRTTIYPWVLVKDMVFYLRNKPRLFYYTLHKTKQAFKKQHLSGSAISTEVQQTGANVTFTPHSPS